MTQNERILDYIRENGSISALEAAMDIGCLQLSARICELQKLGFVFTKTTVKSKNRYGDPVRYKRYSLND